MITLLLLVRATYMYGVVLHAHPVRGESHIQRNTTGKVATPHSFFINWAQVRPDPKCWRVLQSESNPNSTKLARILIQSNPSQVQCSGVLSTGVLRNPREPYARRRRKDFFQESSKGVSQNLFQGGKSGESWFLPVEIENIFFC